MSRQSQRFKSLRQMNLPGKNASRRAEHAFVHGAEAVGTKPASETRTFDLHLTTSFVSEFGAHT